MIELRTVVSREVVGTSVGWMVFPPRESMKLWPWYKVGPRRNWQGWGNIEGHGWDMDGSSKDRVEYEPWMGF